LLGADDDDDVDLLPPLLLSSLDPHPVMTNATTAMRTASHSGPPLVPLNAPMSLLLCPPVIRERIVA
jgi:hypothetical protein